MKHRVSKRKFGYGVDSNSMLLRKLVTNFVIQGKIVTTHEKALYMRSSVDRLVTHAKLDTNSSMNVLKSFFGVDEVASNLKTAVKGVFSDRNSGFTRIVKIGRRASDGALMSEVSWVSPVVYSPVVEPKVEPVKTVKSVKSSKASLPADKSVKSGTAKLKTKKTV